KVHRTAEVTRQVNGACSIYSYCSPTVITGSTAHRKRPVVVAGRIVANKVAVVDTITASGIYQVAAAGSKAGGGEEPGQVDITLQVKVQHHRGFAASAAHAASPDIVTERVISGNEYVL